MTVQGTRYQVHGKRQKNQEAKSDRLWHGPWRPTTCHRRQAPCDGQHAIGNGQWAAGKIAQPCISCALNITIQGNAAEDALRVEQRQAMPLDMKELRTINRVSGTPPPDPTRAPARPEGSKDERGACPIHASMPQHERWRSGGCESYFMTDPPKRNGKE